MDYSAVGAIFSWLNQVLAGPRDGRPQIKRWARGLPRASSCGHQTGPPRIVALAKGWGLQGAAQWSQELLRVDLANKTSVGEPRVNLEKFIVQLCA